MDKFAYTTKIEDNTKFVYPPKLRENANFIYTKLAEIPHAALGIFKNMREIILRR